jgi:hypothetical protein
VCVLSRVVLLPGAVACVCVVAELSEHGYQQQVVYHTSIVWKRNGQLMYGMATLEKVTRYS